MRKTTDKLNFDIENIARILHAEPHAFRDDFGSQNIRMALRDVADPRFEGTIMLNPEARTLTYRTLLDDFRMTNLIHIGVDDGYARFVSRCDHIQKQLWLNADGEMIFNRGVYEPPRVQPKEEPQSDVSKEDKKAGSKRIELTGLVVAKDRDKGLQIVERQSGKKVLELLIGVREDGHERPQWYPLTFFDERAEKALSCLRKQTQDHKPATVIAYEREQISKGQSGTMPSKKVFYGVAIRSNQQSGLRTLQPS